MTRADHKIIFTALGFLAVILRDDIPKDKQALRATGIAQLIDSFCAASEPDAFADNPLSRNTRSLDIERLVADYVAALRATESASLDFDRPTLIKMYELLTIQKMRHEQESFYLLAQDDVIANNVLRLAEEQIGWRRV